MPPVRRSLAALLCAILGPLLPAASAYADPSPATAAAAAPAGPQTAASVPAPAATGPAATASTSPASPAATQTPGTPATPIHHVPVVHPPPPPIPIPACPSSRTPALLTAWRKNAITALNLMTHNSGTNQRAPLLTTAFNTCFPTAVPQCLQRMASYLNVQDYGMASKDTPFISTPQRQPPAELFAAGLPAGTFAVLPNVEQIAASNGWTVARYKSRHSGGFDQGTPSLLMVYIPGGKAHPPVSFDRWVNFALPADNDPDKLNPIPQQPWPTAAQFAAEQAGDNDNNDDDALTDVATATGASTPGSGGSAASGTSAGVAPGSAPATIASGSAAGTGAGGAPATPAAPKLDIPRTFTMITVDRATTPASIYFQKFDRNGTGSPNYTPESYANLTTDCLSCHPNGMRAISPLGYHVRAGEAQLPPDVWTAVDTMNTSMDDAEGGTLVDWRSQPDAAGKLQPLTKPAGYWPIIGPIKPVNPITRTQAFIMGGTASDGSVQKGCYKYRKTVDVSDIFGRPPGANNIYTLSANPQINWKNVRNAMLCETCHNNRDRYSINSHSDQATTDFKILVDQSMPVGAHVDPMQQGDPGLAPADSLSLDERIAVANCLAAETEIEAKYRAQWLSQQACQ